MENLRITPKLRRELKKPHGILLEGSEAVNVRRIKELVNSSKPSKLITVGDVVTSNLINANLLPDLCIVDGKTLRGKFRIELKTEKIFKLRNPRGTVSAKAWEVIRKAISSGAKVGIIVDGEEDLLTIPAVLLAPNRAIVIYGQPDVGVVVVNINEETKKHYRELAKQMEEI
ncbi:MAG: GTP-dependent dephospho-CoA kinase family protein [Candidatus Hodarchaeota archaeon]